MRDLPSPIRLVGQTLLTTSANVVYTVPAGSTVVLTSLLATNRHASSTSTVQVRVGTIWLVAPITLLAGDLFALDQQVVLNAGDTLQAWASVGSAIDFHAAGMLLSSTPGGT